MFTLTDGGQSALDVARRLAEFLSSARESLEIAAYDFNLGAETAAVVAGAIRAAADAGAHVRIVYNVEHRAPVPVPPPPEPDAVLIASLGVDDRAIAGVPDLMHHKYAVRDGEAVWTGSLNWTDDSFTRQENVVAVVESPRLATAYRANFGELWERGNVEGTGGVERTRGMAAWFTPRRGEQLSARIATLVAAARRRVRVCSPVITAAPVLGALAQVASERRTSIRGCVDATQIADVVHQWRVNGNAAWKLPLLERALSQGFSGKPSQPWAPGSLHDFMHAKVVVADDTVFTGSFNLSRSGELNAENVLEVKDARLAEELAAYVESVSARYGGDPLAKATSTPK